MDLRVSLQVNAEHRANEFRSRGQECEEALRGLQHSATQQSQTGEVNMPSWTRMQASAEAVRQPSVDHAVWRWLRGNVEKFMDWLGSPPMLFAGRTRGKNGPTEVTSSSTAVSDVDNEIRRQRKEELQEKAKQAGQIKDPEAVPVLVVSVLMVTTDGGAGECFIGFDVAAPT